MASKQSQKPNLKSNQKSNPRKKPSKKVKIKKKGKWAPIFLLAAIVALPVIDATMLAGTSILDRKNLQMSVTSGKQLNQFKVEANNITHTIKIDSNTSDAVLAWKLTKQGAVVTSREERYPSKGVRRIDFKPSEKGKYDLVVWAVKGGAVTVDVKVIENDKQIIRPMLDAIGL